MQNTIIPKDCLLCDGCNTPITDGNFVSIVESAYWIGSKDGDVTYSTALECEDCYKEYYRDSVKRGAYVVILQIDKGMDLSKTDLAKPMVFTTFDDSDTIQP